jgi:hypothetical protein
MIAAAIACVVVTTIDTCLARLRASPILCVPSMLLMSFLLAWQVGDWRVARGR